METGFLVSSGIFQPSSGVSIIIYYSLWMPGQKWWPITRCLLVQSFARLFYHITNTISFLQHRPVFLELFSQIYYSTLAAETTSMLTVLYNLLFSLEITKHFRSFPCIVLAASKFFSHVPVPSCFQSYLYFGSINMIFLIITDHNIMSGLKFVWIKSGKIKRFVKFTFISHGGAPLSITLYNDEVSFLSCSYKMYGIL